VQGPGSGIGILFDGTSNGGLVGPKDDRVEVQNWKVGVQFINGANNNMLQYVHSVNNRTGGGASGGYGVHLRSTRATTTTNTLDQPAVEANGDEGVHMGGGSGSNTLSNSLVVNNVNQQVYLANSNGNTIRGNWLAGLSTGIAALRVSNSNSNTIDSNLIGTGNV